MVNGVEDRQFIPAAVIEDTPNAERLRLEVASATPMTHPQACRLITVDRWFIEEPIYPGLNSDNATGQADLGTYRA